MGHLEISLSLSNTYVLQLLKEIHSLVTESDFFLTPNKNVPALGCFRTQRTVLPLAR